MADMSQADKDLTAKYREYMAKNPNSTAQDALLATTGLVAPTDANLGTGSTYKQFITAAHSVQDSSAKELQAATAPTDTFDATLREFSRNRINKQMRMTSGSSGSLAGIV